MMRNERGFTLVEVLAVIVILGIVAAIAVPTFGKVIGNVRADAHLGNARQIIESARLAYASGMIPPNDISSEGTEENTRKYELGDLIDGGFIDGNIKNPTIFSWGNDHTDTIYNREESFILLEMPGPTYKVNLAINGLGEGNGGGNLIFSEPQPIEGINRDAFTEVMKEKLGME